jgi:hypothetical protein
MDLDVRAGNIASRDTGVLVAKQRFAGGFGAGIDLDGGFFDSEELPRAVPNAVVLRREVQQRRTIYRERDSGARFLAHADVIMARAMKRSRTKRLNVASNYALNCGREVGGEALRFGYQGVAGGHSERR